MYAGRGLPTYLRRLDYWSLSRLSTSGQRGADRPITRRAVPRPRPQYPRLSGRRSGGRLGAMIDTGHGPSSAARKRQRVRPRYTDDWRTLPNLAPQTVLCDHEVRDWFRVAFVSDDPRYNNADGAPRLYRTPHWGYRSLVHETRLSSSFPIRCQQSDRWMPGVRVGEAEASSAFEPQLTPS